MRIEVIKAYKSVHTWTGIICGLLLYIAFIAGALTMFKSPLNQWALQTDISLSAIPKGSYDELIQRVLTEYPAARENMLVNLPASYPQHAPVTWTVEDHDTHAVTQWHASLGESGKLITKSVTLSAVGEFIDQLHRTAGIPGGDGHDAIGTYILGIISALYFIALVSGLIIFLPTWFKDFLVLRRGNNRKRYWLDFHNVLSISSLPFHLVIALSAFVFAYHDPIYGAMQKLVYGERPMFNRPPSFEVNEQWHELAGVSELTEAIVELEPEFQLTELRYANMGSKRRNVRLSGTMEGSIVRGADFNYALSDPFSAEVLYRPFLPNHQDGYARVVGSFFALHFGNYGGATVRWVYFGLGIAGALIFLTGNILWIESRRKRQRGNVSVQQTRSSLNIARITVGVSLGTLIGISAAMLAAKWLPHARLDILFWQQLTYYLGFVLSVAWCFIKPPIVACRQLLVVTVIMVLLIPISSILTPSYRDFVVSFTAVIAAIILAAIYQKINEKNQHLQQDSVWTFKKEENIC